MDINKLYEDVNEVTIFLLPFLFPGKTYKDIITEKYTGSYLTKDKTRLVLTDSYINKVYFYIPREFRNDVDLFLAGKYTELSAELKTLILNFWLETPNSLLHSILYGTNKVFEEYWAIKFGPVKWWTWQSQVWPPPVFSFLI